MTKYLVLAVIVGICLMYPNQVKSGLAFVWDKFLKLIKVR